MIELPSFMGATKAVNGVPSAVASLVTSAKAMKAQYVVAERAKWRDKIRDAIASIILDPSVKTRKGLWITLKLNTNPVDSEDVALVSLAEKGLSAPFSVAEKEELIDRAALLLKHDWDRAKNEVGSGKVAQRISYRDYVLAKERDFASSEKSWSGQRRLQ